jgi:DNA-binding SARP family transcriptional activator
VLRIELFGTPRISLADRVLPAFASRRATSLFSFLVVHRGRLHERAVLAGTFSGERPEPVARKFLRTDLWQIRRTLQQADGEAERLLIVSDQQIGFEREGSYWLDVQEFEASLDRADRLAAAGSPEAGRHLDVAISLYKADLLEGIYDEWCVYEQERLRALFLRALERGLRLHQHLGDVERALELGARLLRHDPLRESIHREMMRLHVAAGNRAAALRQFQVCTEVLGRELSVEPMEQTLALYRDVLEERVGAGAPAATEERTAPPAAEVMLRELRAAIEEAHRAQSHLLSLLRILEEAMVDGTRAVAGATGETLPGP